MSGGDKTANGRLGPLAGIKIIDMSTVVLGPYATQIFGDLGADVVKIEDARGDIMRHAGTAPAPGMGAIYMALNRNKRSAQLDLKLPAAKTALTALLAGADVFFHNVRLAGMERLGFGYEAVKAINPRIVYVHCCGFGAGGAYDGRQAYDDLVQAASGFADLNAKRDGGEPAYAPSLVADKTTGLHAAYATLAALFHRERTGEGQFVEVPMLESFTMFNLVENLYGRTFVPAMGDMAYTRSVNPNRRPYKTKDGFIAVVPYSDSQWEEFFALGGRPDVMKEPRFSTYRARTENVGALYGLIREVASSKTTDEWLEALGKANIPAMRYNSLEDTLDDPHLKSVGFFRERNSAVVGPYLSMNHPVRFAQSPASVRIDPPALGADTEDVLREAGVADEIIKEIVAARTAGGP